MKFKFCPNCGIEGGVKQENETDYACSICGWKFWNNAKAAVAIAFVRDKQMLVSQRGREPNKGMYDLPGGFVNFGENAYDTAIRETKEETGVDISRESLELLDVYQNDYNPGAFTVDIIFLVRSWQGDFRANDDSAALLWKSLDFIYDESFSEKFYTGLDKAILAKLNKQP